jgi:hypothetical protein
MTEDAESVDALSLDVVYTEIKDRLQDQFDQLRVLDQKASQVFGSASLVITVGLALQARQTSPSCLRVILFIAATVSYALSMILAWLAYRVHTFRRDPEPRPLRDHYLSHDPQFTKRKVVSNLIESYEFNCQSIQSKVRCTQAALLFFLIEALFLAATAVLP